MKFPYRIPTMEDRMDNMTWMTVNNILPENRDLNQDSMEFLDDLREDFYNMESIEEDRIWEIVPGVVSVVLVLFYLYTWVATKSLFSLLGAQELEVAASAQALGTGARQGGIFGKY